MNILLIGTGPMSIAYVEVLKDLNISYSVIGRGLESAKKFELDTGVSPITGGVENYVKNNIIEQGTQAIIATSTESLMPTLKTLLDVGVYKILIEKPAAISIEELLAEANSIQSYAAKIYVAYNRRFYSSVREAEKIIEQDGGLQSLHFEFTEWAHKIDPLTKAKGVKENWFFANSTHVVDLAFHFAGMPIKWQAFSKTGNISWHPISNFTGAGITDKGVLFSYISNWESAGRWSIELLTSKRRIYLKPLETVAIQQKGSINIENHFEEDEFDQNYKPGLFKQVEAFLKDDKEWLVTFDEHLAKTKVIYRNMLNLSSQNHE